MKTSGFRALVPQFLVLLGFILLSIGFRAEGLGFRF